MAGKKQESAVAVEIVANVMFGGQHYPAGAVVEVEAGVAKQLVDQGLGKSSAVKAVKQVPNEAPESEPVATDDAPKAKK